MNFSGEQQKGVELRRFPACFKSDGDEGADELLFRFTGAMTARWALDQFEHLYWLIGLKGSQSLAGLADHRQRHGAILA